MSIFKTVLNTPRFLHSVVNHPLNSHRQLKSISCWLRWHIGSRLVPGAVVIQFVNNSKLLVSPGMRGATENIYTGLYDFEDMSFILHFLQKKDLFIDVGANVGSYTVLASAVRAANSISIEPIPSTFFHLIQNINLNGIYNIIEAHNLGLSNEEGMLNFTSNLDCGNHAVLENQIRAETETIEVKVTTLDRIVNDRKPSLIKIDVEGFENQVIAGGDLTFSQESLLAVIMELNGSGTRYGHDDEVIHEKMLSYGFSPFNYLPFRRKLVPIEKINTTFRNTLYIRNLASVQERLLTAPSFFVNGINI